MADTSVEAGCNGGTHVNAASHDSSRYVSAAPYLAKDLQALAGVAGIRLRGGRALHLCRLALAVDRGVAACTTGIGADDLSGVPRQCRVWPLVGGASAVGVAGEHFACDRPAGADRTGCGPSRSRSGHTARRHRGASGSLRPCAALPSAQAESVSGTGRAAGRRARRRAARLCQHPKCPDLAAWATAAACPCTGHARQPAMVVAGCQPDHACQYPGCLRAHQEHAVATPVFVAAARPGEPVLLAGAAWPHRRHGPGDADRLGADQLHVDRDRQRQQRDRGPVRKHRARHPDDRVVTRDRIDLARNARPARAAARVRAIDGFIY